MRLVLLFFISAVVIVQGDGIRIDNFEATDIAFASDVVTQQISDVSDSSILGGTRRLTARHNSGQGQGILGIRCAVLFDRFSINSDNDQTGSCTVEYAGPSFSGFSPPRDLSFCDCWLSKFESVDEVGVMATFRATTVSDGVLTTAINTGGVNAPGVHICPMFNGPRSAYSAVTAVSVELSTMLDSADAALNFTCCTPAVSCWHSIDFFDSIPNSLMMGDTIGLTISCENFITRPNRTENVGTSLLFPNIGVLDAQSLSCSANANANIFGNSFSSEASLDEGELTWCSFNVTFNTAGDTGDLFFQVLNLNSMGLSRSTSRPNPAGSIEMCDPAVPSRFIVGGLSSPSRAPTISGDPHFIGFKGQKYDFHGVPDVTYNLITDTNFQLNSYFFNADLRPEKKKTYIGKLGLRICYPNHDKDILVYFECDREEHEYIVRVNGKDIAQNETLHFDNTLYFRRSAKENGKTMMKLGYGYHFVVQFSESSHSSCHLNLRTSYSHRTGAPLPHGVLGQSSRRPAGIKGKGWNSPNIVEGDEKEYRVSHNDIFGTEFKHNMYKEGACQGYATGKRSQIDRVYKSYGE